MEEDKKENSLSPKLLHVKIIGGVEADVYDITEELRKLKDKVSFPIEFIVTNDVVELQSVDMLMRQLWKLKKEIEEKQLKDLEKADEVPNM